MPGIEQTMHEFKLHQLHSGSKTGPKVTNRDQAIAIAMSQAGKSKPKPMLQRLADGESATR